MILLFRPSSSSDTFITASSNHLSELMWRALTSWTRLRFVDFFMRDTSSLFKWFNVKVHSWEVGGNKLETLMNILFTPAESSSLPCFYRFIINGWLFVLEIWVTVLFSYESKILETLNWKVVSSAACLHFSFVTQECLQTVELLCSCYWTIHLVHHFDRYRQQPGILLIFRSHWANWDCVTITQSDKTLSYSDSAVNIFDYSDRLLIRLPIHSFSPIKHLIPHRRRDTLVLLWYIVTRPLLFTVGLTAVVLFELVSAPGCRNVVWCTLVFIGYIIKKLPPQAARLLLQQQNCNWNKIIKERSVFWATLHKTYRWWRKPITMQVERQPVCWH